MNLRDLEYLVALAEHHHFGRAAESVYVSQPTLSTQIKKLEAELGVELIERGSRQVMLTHAGERVVRRARHVLGDVDEIRAIARQERSPHTGSLRLGAFPTLAPYLLPHLMPAMAQSYPELEVLLVEEKSQALLAGVRDGSIDAAFIAMPVHDDTLIVEPLFAEEFVLATPAGHPLASSDAVATAELEGEKLLLLNEGHCMREQILDVCNAVGSGERRGFHATSLETLRLMVAAGVGVTLLPQLAVAPPVVANPAVALTPFAEPAPFREIVLVWRRTHVQRDLIEAVAEATRDVATKLPVSVMRPAL